MSQAQVLIVADSPRERWVSMDSYAAGLAAHAESFPVPVRVLRLPLGPPATKTGRVVFAGIDRYCTLPRRVRRAHERLVHIIDHSYGHLVPHAQVPVVITCHDLTPLKTGTPRLGRMMYKRAIAHLSEAQRVVADSGSTRDDLLAMTRVRPRDISVLPLPVGEDFFTSERACSERGSVLHVGSNASYKRVWLAVDAVVALSRHKRGVSFWKVGPALPPELRQRLSSAGVPLRHFGIIPHAEVSRIYAQAGAVIFPSAYEGFGWPLAEAMASRVPVVASAIPVLREVSGDTVTHVDGEDPERYADALGDALRGNGEAPPGAFEWSRRYGWEAHVTGLATVYAGVL